MHRNNFKRTKFACHFAFISTASAFTLPPILFATFHDMYNISYTLLGTLVGWFPEISGSFSATGASDTLLSWLPTIIMLPLTFLMTLWRRYEANRYWLHLMRVDNIEKLYNPFRLFLRLITLPLLYIVFYPLSPSFALVFVSSLPFHS